MWKEKYFLGPLPTNIIAVVGIIATVGFGIWGILSSLDAKEQTELAKKLTKIADERKIEVDQLSGMLNGFLGELNITKNELMNKGVKSALEKGLNNFLEKEGRSFKSIVEAKCREVANREYGELITNATMQLNKQQYNAAFGFLILANAYKPESKEVEGLLNKTLAGMGSAAKFRNGLLTVSANDAEKRLEDQNGVILGLDKVFQSGDEINCYFEIKNTTDNDLNLETERDSEITANGVGLNINTIRFKTNEIGKSEVKMLLPEKAPRRFIARFYSDEKVDNLSSIVMRFRTHPYSNKKFCYRFENMQVKHRDGSVNEKEHSNVAIKVLKIEDNGAKIRCKLLVANNDPKRKLSIDTFEKTYFSNGLSRFKPSYMVFGQNEYRLDRNVDVLPNDATTITLVFNKDTNDKFGKLKELIIPVKLFHYNRYFVFRIPVDSLS